MKEKNTSCPILTAFVVISGIFTVIASLFYYNYTIANPGGISALIGFSFADTIFNLTSANAFLIFSTAVKFFKLLAGILLLLSPFMFKKRPVLNVSLVYSTFLAFLSGYLFYRFVNILSSYSTAEVRFIIPRIMANLDKFYGVVALIGAVAVVFALMLGSAKGKRLPMVLNVLLTAALVGICLEMTNEIIYPFSHKELAISSFSFTPTKLVITVYADTLIYFVSLFAGSLFLSILLYKRNKPISTKEVLISMRPETNIVEELIKEREEREETEETPKTPDPEISDFIKTFAEPVETESTGDKADTQSAE